MHTNKRPVEPPPSQDTPSLEYRLALQDAKHIHYGKACTGRFLRPHAPYIKEIIDRLGVRSILDYGCGKGQQYAWIMPDNGLTMEQWWGIEVTKFDPAYPPYAKEPRGNFDLVLCTHTLSMIPTTDQPWVIDRLYKFARKGVYIAERLHKPRKEVGNPRLRSSLFGWGMLEWQQLIERPGSSIEVTLCTRVKQDDGARVQMMSKWDGAAWTNPRQMISGGGFAD